MLKRQPYHNNKHYGVAVAALLLWCLSAVIADSAAQQREADPAASAALFQRLYPVLSHPRCTNCHSVEDQTRAGDAQYRHLPPVPRGDNGFGDNTLPCSTCHSHRNTPIAPGATGWQAAPLSMGWYGLTAAQLCRTLTDRSNNGDRSLEDLNYHMRTSPTVLWAWEPGGILSAPTLPRADFRKLFSDWVAGGGACPAE
jgi:hypothetical protein